MDQALFIIKTRSEREVFTGWVAGVFWKFCREIARRKVKKRAAFGN